MWLYDKNKTGILLEIILNISKCLTVPLSRKISFYGNSIIFLLRLMYFVNLNGARCAYFTVWGDCCTHSKVINFCLLLYYYARGIVELGTKQGIKLFYDSYNQTRQHFANWFFSFQWMSPSNLSLINFLKFWTIYFSHGSPYLLCKQITFGFTI